MATEEETRTGDFLKTHTQYKIPGEKFVPIVIARDRHPLTSTEEPIFFIHVHLEVAKGRLKNLARLIEKAEKTNQDYLGWGLSGEIYLPNT